MQSNKRPIYVRLTDEEREEFDIYCFNMGINFSIIVRAMIKDCLERIKKGELKLDILSGFAKVGRPSYHD